MTISACELFGRKVISPKERKILKAANKAAKCLFDMRFNDDIKKEWDIDIKNVTLSYVESTVIEALLAKYDIKKEGRIYAKNVI